LARHLDEGRRDQTARHADQASGGTEQDALEPHQPRHLAGLHADSPQQTERPLLFEHVHRHGVGHPEAADEETEPEDRPQRSDHPLHERLDEKLEIAERSHDHRVVGSDPRQRLAECGSLPTFGRDEDNVRFIEAEEPPSGHPVHHQRPTAGGVIDDQHGHLHSDRAPPDFDGDFVAGLDPHPAGEQRPRQRLAAFQCRTDLRGTGVDRLRDDQRPRRWIAGNHDRRTPSDPSDRHRHSFHGGHALKVTDRLLGADAVRIMVGGNRSEQPGPRQHPVSAERAGIPPLEIVDAVADRVPEADTVGHRDDHDAGRQRRPDRMAEDLLHRQRSLDAETPGNHPGQKAHQEREHQRGGRHERQQQRDPRRHRRAGRQPPDRH